MTVYQRVVIIAAVCLCIGGIMMLLDVPFMTKGMKQKYTDESVKSYLESVAKSGTVLHDAGWVLFIAGVIIPMFLSKGLQSK